MPIPVAGIAIGFAAAFAQPLAGEAPCKVPTNHLGDRNSQQVSLAGQF